MVSDDEFPDELHGRVWHTTIPVRYDGILRTGSIVPNPAIPDSERWGTGLGPKHYPYVRVLDGVSLFDFHGFDAKTYSDEYPGSSWRTFVPYRCDKGAAIWMEIDTTRLCN